MEREDSWIAPSLARLQEMAEAARGALPPAFADGAIGVEIVVADLADEELAEEFAEGDAYSLTGLYEGTPLTERAYGDLPQGPDRIWLFRLAILDEWARRADVTLGELVAHIYVHELAHHFGWSDEDIARIDRWWE